MRQRSARGQNDVWRQGDQFRSIFAIVLGIGCGKAIINPHIVAVGPAQLLQSLLECREAYLDVLIVRGQARKHPDPPHPLPLLRARGKRPRGRRHAAEQRHERAALHHSITSSARASSVAGTSRSSALAVLRLITNSNLVGSCTGSSPAVAPRKMRSIYTAARRSRSARTIP